MGSSGLGKPPSFSPEHQRTCARPVPPERQRGTGWTPNTRRRWGCRHGMTPTYHAGAAIATAAPPP
eukprot:9951317-Prorocentrum_lima.AAC.1